MKNEAYHGSGSQVDLKDIKNEIKDRLSIIMSYAIYVSIGIITSKLDNIISCP